MITSTKGEKMISSITPIYAKSYIEQAIYEAIGIECDEFDGIAENILLQFFPQTATWSLSWWEQRLGLTTNLTEDIEIRRRKVLSKLQTRYTINPEKLAIILKSYTGACVEIIEDVEPYTFEVTIQIEEAKELINFINIVKKLKPSHLDYKLNAQANTCINSNIEIKKNFNDYHETNDMDCGVFHDDPVTLGRLIKFNPSIISATIINFLDYPVCGSFVCGEVIE